MNTGMAASEKKIEQKIAWRLKQCRSGAHGEAWTYSNEVEGDECMRHVLWSVE